MKTVSGASVQSNPFDVLDGSPRYLDLKIQLSVGALAGGAPLKSKAGGLAPGSEVTLEVHSAVRIIATKVTDANGTVEFDSSLPADLEPGTHLVVLRGNTPAGDEVSSTAGFTLDASGRVLSVVAPSESLSGVPSAPEMARAVSVGLPLYDTASNVATSAGLAVTATVVMVVTAAGAASGTSGSSRKSDGGGRQEGEVGEPSGRETTSQGEIGGLDADSMGNVDAVHPGRGDALGSWTLPWYGLHQRVVERGYVFVSTKSSAVARLLADGHWFRAVFGSLQAVLWAVMLAIGAFLGFGVAGIVAPTVGWVSIVVVVSLFDAFAGTCAWIGFTSVVAGRFGLHQVFDLRTILGLGVLFMGVPLIANHARPLRRIVADRLDWIDRVADYAMLPLLMSFATKGVYTALNGLSGLQMVSGTQAVSFSRVVLVAVVARMIVEDVVTRTHPLRMVDTAMPATDGTPLPVDIGTLVVKAGLFLLGAGSFFGLGWRTWLVAAFMTVVPFLKLFADRFPNSPFVHRWFPKGVLRTVIMMWAGAWMAGLILGGDSSAGHTKEMTAFLMLPGVTIGLVDIIGREGGAWPDVLWKRLVGGCLWTFSFLVMFGFIAI